MDIREIAAEKIRAMNDRARYRDFYDFAMIISKLNLFLEDVIDLVKQKEIRYPISQNNILGNWELVKSAKDKESEAIYFTQEIANEYVADLLKKFDLPDLPSNIIKNQ